ncbi:MAG: AEC family transporter [Clostridiaceae bacterium]|nr:AEC family transporter [Clostridiaceae bacterium]
MIWDNALLVGNQVLILFLLIFVGLAARRFHLLDEQGVHQLTNLLLVIITPTVIILSFQTPFERTLLLGILIAAGFAVLTHVVGAVAGRICFRHQPDGRRRVLSYAVVFSNCGFMCLPLLDAVLGSRGIFYGSVYIAVFNIAQWTYGIILMAGRQQEIKLRRALLNPGTVALLIGLPLFLAGIRLPALPTRVLEYVAAVNSPVAMFIIGAQMASVSLHRITGPGSFSLAVALRLLVVPLVMLLGLLLIPLDRVLALSILIPAAAPAAAATAIFAGRYKQDTTLATQLVTVTTFLSILTMPLLILVHDLLI